MSNPIFFEQEGREDREGFLPDLLDLPV